MASMLYKNAYKRAFFTLYGIVFKEVRVAFKQFFTWRHPFYSLYHVLAVIWSAKLRVILGRSLKYSFAFTGEDRILESIYKPRITENGFYVEVGCNHPKFLSNTYSLYRKGWRGICIDGNKQLIKKYKKVRPRDIAICALVSNEVTTKTFYVAENDVLSTMTKTNLEGEDMKNISVEQQTMQTNTLTNILREVNAPSIIDILSIDAEEHDFEVLQSLDFTLYQPKLIIVEDETFSPVQPKDNNIYNFLSENGYTLEGYILKNLYFSKL